MTTLAEFRRSVRKRLRGARQQRLDLLATTVDTDDTSIVLTYGQRINRGSIIEIDDEEMYVWSWTEATKTALVRRGWNDTTAEAHTAGAVIEIAPRWPATDIDDLIREELESWPRDLGKVEIVETTVGIDQHDAELTWTGDEILWLLATFTQAGDAAFSRWLPIDAGLLRMEDGSYRIRFADAGLENRTIQLHLLTAFDLSALSADLDLETELGLTAGMLDVLRLGVAWRSVLYGEIDRTTASAASPQATEQSPPTHLMQTAQALEGARQRRIGQEMARIRDEYPIRRSVL